MRLWAIELLFLPVFLMAETQEEIYFRAMKAEESGNISHALELFEKALAAEGPYTAEIQEIVADYREAMGMDSVNATSDESETSWEFYTSGDINFSRLHYRQKYVGTSRESGNELYGTLNIGVDYDTPKWIHSFGITASGDWFMDKEDMPSLDTNSWESSLGAEYTLIGKTLSFNIGANLNVSENESWNPDFFIWVEKYFVRFGSQKIGLNYWAYENLKGLASLALYASWHRNAIYGWNGAVYAGARYEADSISIPEYWLQWMGPSLKPRVSYKFKNDVSLDARLNLFCGFIIDGPYASYEKIQKLQGTWNFEVSWEPTIFGVYIGIGQTLRRYILPSSCKYLYPDYSIYTDLKAGIRWDI